jgi:hypothetical protein
VPYTRKLVSDFPGDRKAVRSTKLQSLLPPIAFTSVLFLVKSLYPNSTWLNKPPARFPQNENSAMEATSTVQTIEKLSRLIVERKNILRNGLQDWSGIGLLL